MGIHSNSYKFIHIYVDYIHYKSPITVQFLSNLVGTCWTTNFFDVQWEKNVRTSKLRFLTKSGLKLLKRKFFNEYSGRQQNNKTFKPKFIAQAVLSKFINKLFIQDTESVSYRVLTVFNLLNTILRSKISNFLRGFEMALKS